MSIGKEGIIAAHIETGTMVDPRYESRHLGHLGLVAGIFDELGLGEALEAAAPGLMASPEKLSLQRQEADYAGVKQRWVVVYSPQAYRRALKSVNRRCEKQSEADLKALQALCRRDFACAADAQKALTAFEKGRWLCAVADFTVSKWRTTLNEAGHVTGNSPRP